MMRDPRDGRRRPHELRMASSAAALTASLALGACSQSAKLLEKVNLSPPATQSQTQAPDAGGDDLQKATLYWGQEYSKQPSDLKTALSYARNLKAMGEKQKALSVLQQASALHDGDPELAGEYGRLALDLGQVGLAGRLLAIADNPAKPDWKVISARGTVSAKQGDYKQAVAAYERALALSNNQPSVLNNLAMAHAMSGNATKAEELLRKAAATGETDAKVQQNLALVLGLQGRYDEAKTSIAAASGTSTEAVNSDTELLRSVVKVAAKSAPQAEVPSFATASSGADDAAPAHAAETAAPSFALRPAVDEALAASPWQTTVAANAAP